LLASKGTTNASTTSPWCHMFGRKAVESTEVLFLMDGVGYLLRGLALQNIPQKNTTQDKRWLYRRGKFARDTLNCIKQGS